MSFGICLISIIPVRSEPSDKAELCTQLLFGELYTILESTTEKKWIRIKIKDDDYEGWISSNQSYALSEEQFNQLHKLNKYYVSSILGLVRTNDNIFPILCGSVFYSLPIHKKLMVINNTPFNIDSTSLLDSSSPPSDRHELITFAFSFLNTPYLWGGRTHFGIDCSGFTQHVFKLNGYRLPRDAWQQAEEGVKIPLTAAQEGDLAFFKNNDEKITHVGIVLKNHSIIHASGHVRIDGLDEKGIYKIDNEKQTYTHQLAMIKKIIP